ncbi:MAG: Integrase, catalytic region [Cypionkella sp.]|uniref:transposase domain-containing protein n=1 Tax=Cypionkella sp. TaxID=2811411 RepID=UPI002624E0C3|nr:transposase domain-containing protein [Cypionkella sp.]MDB5658346.1 Integrase, catalytic region [Cypionkella sp.]
MSSPITPSQEWWTAEEIAVAALPDLPASKRGVNMHAERLCWRENGPNSARRREGKGGGWEYNWQLFPDRAKRKMLQAAAVKSAAPQAPARQSRDEAWEWFEALPQSVKDKALARLKIIQQVEALEALQGRGRHMAAVDIAKISGTGTRTIWTWFQMIEGVRSDDRLAYLAPRNRAAATRARAKDFSPEFFEVLKGDFLRLGPVPFADSYRRSIRIAEKKGWDTLPERTMRRVMDRRVSKVTQVLAREGVEALQRLYPPQMRDKTALAPMEAVNADFHKFDVFASWPAPKGEKPIIGRPQMVAFQDIYSGRILSWRIDVNPNSTAVQLCAGDMIETWGIPEHILLDNGREFAAKSITGGAATRYRFKVKEDDIPGLFTSLGTKIHFATPYHGQAKPIERAFRDMCRSIALDPRFAGAYTGNSPLAKPEDYGSRAIPLEEFERVLAEGIEEHNTRVGRRSEVAWGRSFAQVFDEAYATAPIRKATEAQRRLWLLGAEGIRADKSTGAIWFQRNEFYADWLHEYAGDRLIIRFDLAAFHDGLHVYSADNAYLGFAPCRQAVGFFDMDEGKSITRMRKAWMNAEKAALAAHRTLTAAEVGRMLDDTATAPLGPVGSKVVKGAFGKGNGLPQRPRSAPANSDAEVHQAQAVIIADLAARRAQAAPAEEETARQRFKRMLELERRIEAGEPVTKEQRSALQGYQTSPEYIAERSMWSQFGEAYSG